MISLIDQPGVWATLQHGPTTSGKVPYPRVTYNVCPLFTSFSDQGHCLLGCLTLSGASGKGSELEYKRRSRCRSVMLNFAVARETSLQPWVFLDIDPRLDVA